MREKAVKNNTTTYTVDILSERNVAFSMSEFPVSSEYGLSEWRDKVKQCGESERQGINIKISIRTMAYELSCLFVVERQTLAVTNPPYEGKWRISFRRQLLGT